MKLFIDANAFVSVSVITDSLHQTAVAITQKLAEQTIDYFTSSDVLKEAATVISQRAGKNIAVEFLDQVEAKAQIVFIDESLHKAGLKIFRKIKAKDISVVDCTSFAVMKKLDISTAFSFDREFATAGFTLIKNS